MERSFILDKFNTWYDWNLILTAKTIAPPTPKTNYVELEGMNGSLDLSEALTGEVTYSDRTVSASFWTDHGSRQDRVRLLRDIRLSLHGKKVKVIEPDDLTHYLYGRVIITSENNITPYAEIQLEIQCEPWRYSLDEVRRSVDVKNNIVDIVVDNNGMKTLCPNLEVKGTVKIVKDGVEITLNEGVWKVTDLKLKPGTNVVKVSGNGSVTFIYREADL